MPDTERLITAEELERFPEDDWRYELAEGRLIRMSPAGYVHGRVTMRVGFLLEQHVRTHNLGVVQNEVGFKLASNPDTVRAPDIAFIRRDRIPSTDPKGFWNGPPDVAVEVLSPDDTPTEIRKKAVEYLTRGASIVLVIDPGSKTATTFTDGTSTTIAGADEELSLSPVVAGFRCRVRDIFE